MQYVSTLACVRQRIPLCLQCCGSNFLRFSSLRHLRSNMPVQRKKRSAPLARNHSSPPADRKLQRQRTSGAEAGETCALCGSPAVRASVANGSLDQCKRCGDWHGSKCSGLSYSTLSRQYHSDDQCKAEVDKSIQQHATGEVASCLKPETAHSEMRNLTQVHQTWSLLSDDDMKQECEGA